MPVMEIVFVLDKTSCIVNEEIRFSSVWGLPLEGERVKNCTAHRIMGFAAIKDSLWTAFGL